MKPLDINSKYLIELSNNCYDHLETFIEENVIDHEKQTITYKGEGNVHYENQKLLIAISRLLVAQRDLKIYEIQSEIIKGLRESFNG